ncbi:PAAR domain-containing protein [Aquitalea sp. USM4]|uniref:PAAR domain-containing protein n=1 Tax=Aquitalea TaxID=407217 RepID=UPI00103F043F|nr:PAAR domain-containing protein [Aquitalea sp. USM4]QBJ78885.1 hypothetical protein DKK66_12830 [Aquitalea sp. USM4]
MSRYAIRQHDSLTGGGEVLDVIPDGPVVEGIGLSFVGGKAKCFRCGQVGTIVADGPRGSVGGLNGYTVALNNDLVMCHCPVPPRLLHSSTAWQVD